MSREDQRMVGTRRRPASPPCQPQCTRRDTPALCNASLRANLRHGSRISRDLCAVCARPLACACRRAAGSKLGPQLLPNGHHNQPAQAVSAEQPRYRGNPRRERVSCWRGDEAAAQACVGKAGLFSPARAGIAGASMVQHARSEGWAAQGVRPTLGTSRTVRICGTPCVRSRPESGHLSASAMRTARAPSWRAVPAHLDGFARANAQGRPKGSRMQRLRRVSATLAASCRAPPDDSRAVLHAATMRLG